MKRLPAITHAGFSLFRFRSPLLAESRLFSLPVGNEMFHFPTFPPPALCVQAGVTGHDSCRVSPFGNPRITARLAAPRGLSQPPTSFIGSWCQGIHRAPLLTWPQRCSRPLCSSQGTGGARSGSPRTQKHCGVRRGSGPSGHTDRGRSRGDRRERDPVLSGAANSPRPQDPTACRGRCVAGGLRSTPPRWEYWEPTHDAPPTGQSSSHEHHPRRERPRRGSGRPRPPGAP